uniref:Tetratricopeptide repeat domain lipoprotein n=1 Tax=uncultured bacterium CSL12 TaxID=1091567 RepID=G4WVI5_9BACT|nr:tetratricopeptide repeat domain lipoprotein [uncultured bacterium CSL12]
MPNKEKQGMTEFFEIRDLVDASRAVWARAHADMDVATGALDPILSARSKGIFGLWDAIDEQIGKAAAPGLRERLMELRARFVESVVAAEVARIEKAFGRSPDEGWNAWQITLAESISYFRQGLSTRLCEYPFPFQGRESRAQEMAKAVRCIFQGRWPEAYDELTELAKKQFLPAATRAKLLVILGEIQLYRLQTASPARELFDAAAALAPDDARVVGALGDYWTQNNEEPDLQEAAACFQRAQAIAPGSGIGQVGMGDICEKNGKLEEAERCYREAIAAASGEGSGYTRLVQLYGRPELFAKHEADLWPITERAIAVGPEGEYTRYINLGDIYAQNKQFEKARSWHEKAIALDGTNPEGHVAVAACYEKSGSLDQAETGYKRAIELAPECYDGYWALTWLYEQQGRWQDALEWFDKFPLHRKEWAGIVRAKVGEMHAKLGNYREAEEILKHELRTNHKNQRAKDVLHTIAQDYYTKRGDKDAAMRVYADVLEILRDYYQGDYHNQLGKLNYYFDEYDRAAEEYRRAIAVECKNAVYHRNLATACRSLKHYSEAAHELERARAIDGSSEKFNEEMALLANAEANDCFERGDYKKAIDLYTKAIEHSPHNDVLHSNLAGAWEQVKETGGRIDALDKAIDAYERAQRIDPSGEYAKSIERLRRRRKLAASYGEKALDWLHVVTPIAIEVAHNLIPLVEGSNQDSLSDDASKHIGDMRQSIEDRFGVKIPGIRIRGNEADLPDGVYIIMLMEIPLVSGTVMPDHRFSPATEQALAALGVKGKAAPHPLTGEDGFWIGRDDWQRVEAAEHELWGVMKYLVLHLEAVIQRNLAEFLGHDQVADLLKTTSAKELGELRAQPGKHTALTTLCRALVAEEVPISEFSAIYKAFHRGFSEGAGLLSIVESIRALPVLGPRLPGNERKYAVLPLGPRYEAGIKHAIYQSDFHSVLAMEPERCQDALTALRNEVGAERNLALMVHDPQLRPFVRRLIELEFPHIPVLSQRELRTVAEIRTARPVELEEDSAPERPIGKSHARFDVSAAGPTDGTSNGAPEPAEIAITVFANSAFAEEQAGADDQPIKSMLSMMQDGLFYELGVVLPEVRLEVDSNLKTTEFRFSLNGREYPPVAGLARDEFLVNDTVDRLMLLNIKGRKAFNPANGSECAVVREENTLSKSCREASLTVWGPAGFLVLALSAAIRKRAAAFQTADVTQCILESLHTAFPELIDKALKRFTVEQLCLVLRSLLDEEISIRDMRSILESLVAINGTTDADLSRYIVFAPYAEQLCPVAQGTTLSDLTISDYSSFVRASLKRYISHKYTRGGNTLVVYLLDPDIEERIGGAVTRPLADEEQARVIRAVGDEVGNLPPTAQNPVLLTTMDIRRPLRRLLEADFPNLAVVSYQELSPDLNIQPIARISWDK